MMKIQITDDFDLDRIAESGQCFRWQKDDTGIYRIIHKDHILRIRPSGKNTFVLSCSEDDYRNIWYGYFDLGEVYRSIRERICKEDDPFLAGACEFGKGIRILRQDPWEMLISFIISQNRNIPTIKKSVELLCEAAGQQREDAGCGYYVFPTPEEILSLSDEALAACRLGYRCRYVKAAAADVAEGRLDLNRLSEASESDTLKALTAVCGVGVKVANCVSLFGLHHIDAFPVDVWIRRILENEYPAGYPKEKYSPYNGIYQQYMFYYYRKKALMKDKYYDQAAACVKDYVLPAQLKLYQSCDGDLDRVYGEAMNGNGYFGRVIEPGHIYELGYEKCTCQKVLSGQITDPDLCNCSRQSILYILSRLEPNSHFEVEIIETILRGAEHCRFRITKK